MDTRITNRGLVWEVSAVSVISSRNGISWEFDLHMKGIASYLTLAFPDQKTAQRQRAVLQKMIDESIAIIPMIVR